MGLWLKCPGCQSNNPLSFQICPKCGRSLDNLPRQERVYVIGAPETAAPEVQPVAAKAPTGPGAVKPAKQPKKPRPKKS